MGVFFTIFEKVKKHIFVRNFFKMGPMDLKICAKKLVIGPDLHQKYYRSRIIFRKYMTFQKRIMFCFPPLYMFELLSTF